MRLFIYLVSCLVLVFSTVQPAAAILIDHNLVEKSITQYDSRVGDVCEDPGTSNDVGATGDVDRFLQVLADQESSGNPTAYNSGSHASGKYQYIPSTWRDRVSGGNAIYPPASRYAEARDAPEAVQDAVAYIEYSKKFIQYNSDIFKLAVSHFYPAANDNPALLDVVPEHNTITPREYAQSIMSKITEGVGTNIPLKYRQAPEFDRYNTAGSTSGSSSSTPTQDPATTPSQDNLPTGSKKVFLDPGHGAAVPEYADPVTGLHDRETPNTPESSDVLDVTKRVKAQLETDGYSVALARTDNNTQVNKRKRVDAAKDMGADIAVSIHTTPGTAVNDVWSQKVGTYREYGSSHVTFQNDATAEKSQNYANVIADARREAEARTVNRDTNNAHQSDSFNRAGVPSKGNISLVQLWSKDIPWVYSEYGIKTGDGLTEQDKQKYSDGLVKGIEKAIGNSIADTAPDNTDCSDGGGTADIPPSGDFAQTVLAYAWPTYHSPNYLVMKPAYRTAVARAQAQNRYVGGGTHPGVDCGGFVTTLMVDSGFDPKYNHGGALSSGAGSTPVQEQWLAANWQRLGTGSTIDAGELQPGDVAINGGDHTFVYVGTIPGFSKKVASASYSPHNTAWRTPMAGAESVTDPTMTWYRKK